MKWRGEKRHMFPLTARPYRRDPTQKKITNLRFLQHWRTPNRHKLKMRSIINSNNAIKWNHLFKITHVKLICFRTTKISQGERARKQHLQIITMRPAEDFFSASNQNFVLFSFLFSLKSALPCRPESVPLIGLVVLPSETVWKIVAVAAVSPRPRLTPDA
jgi:hypothetical protein